TEARDEARRSWSPAEAPRLERVGEHVDRHHAAARVVDEVLDDGDQFVVGRGVRLTIRGRSHDVRPRWRRRRGRRRLGPGGAWATAPAAATAAARVTLPATGGLSRLALGYVARPGALARDPAERKTAEGDAEARGHVPDRVESAVVGDHLDHVARPGGGEPHPPAPPDPQPPPPPPPPPP